MSPVVNLQDRFAKFADHWHPRLVGELNGQHVRLVKFQGPFTWHHHESEDEMFFVVDGEFDMRFRDRTERVRAGEFIIVPRGVEHCPYAEREVSVMLFEPAGTVNTGNVREERTRDHVPQV
jgi:mannose-6-phosphate isomerase-like protein (cupin superfamily)